MWYNYLHTVHIVENMIIAIIIAKIGIYRFLDLDIYKL